MVRPGRGPWSPRAAAPAGGGARGLKAAGIRPAGPAAGRERARASAERQRRPSQEFTLDAGRSSGIAACGRRRTRPALALCLAAPAAAGLQGLGCASGSQHIEGAARTHPDEQRAGHMPSRAPRGTLSARTPPYVSRTRRRERASLHARGAASRTPPQGLLAPHSRPPGQQRQLGPRRVDHARRADTGPGWMSGLDRPIHRPMHSLGPPWLMRATARVAAVS
jgi:hypothetical protein